MVLGHVECGIAFKEGDEAGWVARISRVNERYVVKDG